MNNFLKKTIFVVIVLTTSACFGGYSNSAVNARVYRQISKKCQYSSSLETCRNFYFSKVTTNKSGEIIADEDGKRIKDDNGNVIIPEDYKSKGWFGKLLISSNQQLEAMGNY